MVRKVKRLTHREKMRNLDKKIIDGVFKKKVKGLPRTKTETRDLKMILDEKSWDG